MTARPLSADASVLRNRGGDRAGQGLLSSGERGLRFPSRASRYKVGPAPALKCSRRRGGSASTAAVCAGQLRDPAPRGVAAGVRQLVERARRSTTARRDARASKRNEWCDGCSAWTAYASAAESSRDTARLGKIRSPLLVLEDETRAASEIRLCAGSFADPRAHRRGRISRWLGTYRAGGPSVHARVEVRLRVRRSADAARGDGRPGWERTINVEDCAGARRLGGANHSSRSPADRGDPAVVLDAGSRSSPRMARSAVSSSGRHPRCFARTPERDAASPSGRPRRCAMSVTRAFYVIEPRKTPAQLRRQS